MRVEERKRKEKKRVEKRGEERERQGGIGLKSEAQKMELKRSGK